MTMSTKHLLVALTILAGTPAFPQAAQTGKKPAVAATLPQDKQLLALITLAAAPLLPPVMAQDHPPATPAGKKPAVAQAAPQQEEDEGQRIFEQNCSRCHNAPEGFSPRISGTIVRHMRMRASLSKHDEDALLHFFNP
jgi:mono/diheme cytochrome c family protein